MLLQSLTLVAILVMLGGALMTEALFAVKIAYHVAVARDAAAAVERASIDATSALRDYVKVHGADGPWPSAMTTIAATPMCATAGAATCERSFTADWKITSGPLADPSSAATATAYNVQREILHENRVAAVVVARIIGANGEELGSRTRYLTLRVLNSQPYATVTGVRDIETILGKNSSMQGDTSGTLANTAGTQRDMLAPDPTHPGYYHDTVVKASLSCDDASFNEGFPWGNTRGGAPVAPCAGATPAPIPEEPARSWEDGSVTANDGWSQ
ncbi:MAG: hypothetical protein ACREM6_15475 [Vulcanimicrobiaceae bacterium]